MKTLKSKKETARRKGPSLSKSEKSQKKKTSKRSSTKSSKSPKEVAVIMGSQSDFKVMQEACRVLEDFKIPYHLEVVSAHRTPQKMFTFAKEAESRGFKVIIAGAGGAAHLPGMVASLTTLPVIGVPVQNTKLKGLDSLLSIAQMPAGVPVACMAIDNATNAGLFAARILALTSVGLDGKLKVFEERQQDKVRKMQVELSGKTMTTAR